MLIEHQSICNYVQWAKQFFINNNGCGVPVHTSFAFDITITAIYPPLLSRHPLYILEEDKGLDGLIEALSGHNYYSLIKLTPTHLKILQESLTISLERCVKVIVVGGELLESKLVQSLIDKNACIINEYGPTEATVGCIATQITNEIFKNQIKDQVARRHLNELIYLELYDCNKINNKAFKYLIEDQFVAEQRLNNLKSKKCFILQR